MNIYKKVLIIFKVEKLINAKYSKELTCSIGNLESADYRGLKFKVKAVFCAVYLQLENHNA